MTSYWQLLWRKLSAQDSKDKVEVERIGTLQRLAVSRRAEYAEQKAQIVMVSDESLPDLLSSSRARMREAEAAHTVALQRWENKQSRQKSR